MSLFSLILMAMGMANGEETCAISSDGMDAAHGGTLLQTKRWRETTLTSDLALGAGLGLSDEATYQGAPHCAPFTVQASQLQAFANVMSRGRAEALGAGETATLDANGFRETTLLCCPVQMEMFFTRLLQLRGYESCSKRHLQGLMHWFTCVPDMDFQYVLNIIENGNPCKYWAPIGQVCPSLSPECEGKSCSNVAMDGSTDIPATTEAPTITEDQTTTEAATSTQASSATDAPTPGTTEAPEAPSTTKASTGASTTTEGPTTPQSPTTTEATTTTLITTTTITTTTLTTAATTTTTATTSSTSTSTTSSTTTSTLVTTTTTTLSPVRMIVADTYNDRILEYSLGSELGVLVAGHGGSGSGASRPLLVQYNSTTSVATDQLLRPDGVTWNSGFYYIADTGNHRIVKWQQGATYGVVLLKETPGLGTGAQLSLKVPTYVEYDAAQDELLITDSRNDRIIKWNLGTNTGTILVHKALIVGVTGNYGFISDPSNAVYDIDGDVVFSNYGSDTILKWTPEKDTEEDPPVVLAGSTTQPESYLGDTPGEPLRLNHPSSVKLDSNSDYIIVDRQNHRVLKLPRGSTQASTLAGNVVSGGDVFGSSSLNHLNYPSDAAFFTDGPGLSLNLGIFVADRSNHRVVHWLPGATEGVLVAGVTSSRGASLNNLAYPAGIAVRYAA